MEYVLTTQNLSKSYSKFQALDHFTMHVPKGAIYGFVGRNGAGKTTYNVSDLVADADTGYYTVYFRGILATEYDETVTAEFYYGDTQVGQGVTYSVNSYVYSKQGDSATALAELVKATYNYGTSAEAYVAENTNK